MVEQPVFRIANGLTERPRTIAVVDDEPKIRLLLRRCLEGEGYHVLEAEDQETLFEHIDAHDVDLVTLDLNLGTQNGLSVAAALRARTNVPVIIVSGKDDVIDRVVGLEVGADDYITKPFHLREVVARIRTVLRRAEERVVRTDRPKDDALHFGGWRIRPDHMELVDPHGEPRDLTTAEFKLLMIFVERPKRVLSRDQLMDLIGGHEWTPLDRTVDNQIARLRRKIEDDPAHPKFIKTVRGAGYTFAADVSGT